MTTFEVNWQGSRVYAVVRHATQWGIDSTMADCVATAKSLVPVKTAILQGSIQMRPAVDTGDVIYGYWGSFAVKYALWVEQGTGEHVILPVNKKALFWPGADHPVRMVFHPGTKARPFLMPAAEMHYPSLALRIRAQIAWGGAS
jgi:hypothetical protein